MTALKNLVTRFWRALLPRVLILLGRIRGVSWVVRYLRNPDPRVTVPLLTSFGAVVGPGTVIKGSLFIDNAYTDANSTNDFSHLRIGGNCYIGDAVHFDLANVIDISDNVVISGQVAILTHADCNAYH